MTDAAVIPILSMPDWDSLGQALPHLDLQIFSFDNSSALCFHCFHSPQLSEYPDPPQLASLPLSFPDRHRRSWEPAKHTVLHVIPFLNTTSCFS